MGGPFRAIVGGSARYRWTFGPAAWIRVDNNSTQYFQLVELDDYVAPGQINKFINVDGIVSITGIFAAPPGASQAAPTAGQIAQVWTYDVGVPGGPLGPSPGLLLPIGLDSPQHFHHHTATHAHNPHLHGHSATHVHGSATHLHTQPQHSHLEGTQISNTGPASAGTAHTHAYNDAGAQSTFLEGDQNTGNTTPGNTGATAPGNTDNANVPAATPGDSDLENVQHTHP